MKKITKTVATKVFDDRFKSTNGFNTADLINNQIAFEQARCDDLQVGFVFTKLVKDPNDDRTVISRKKIWKDNTAKEEFMKLRRHIKYLKSQLRDLEVK